MQKMFSDFLLQEKAEAKRRNSMKKYAVVPANTDVRRSFAITTGLQEGYGPTGVTHNVNDVVNAAAAWMKSRAAAGQPFITGTVSAVGTVVYAYPTGSGAAESGTEPSATFSGEVSVLYSANLADEQVVDLLNNLAASLGNALGQTRVYVAYRDRTWVIQAEETATPTGETVEVAAQ